MAVFSLNEVRSLQVKNKDTNFTSWPENLEDAKSSENYVFLGSTISKYTFTTDTASLPGNQVAPWNGVNSSAGTSIANYLGAGVGYLSASPSLVQKFDVTNETNTSLPGAIPSSDTGYGGFMSLTHSPTAFYTHGGANPPNGRTNINRMPFSDETIVNIGNGAFPRNSQSTLSSPADDAGFIFAGSRYGGGGAYDYNEMSKIERFTFSTETDSQPGNFPGTVYMRRGTSQNPQYGWLCGGVNIPPSGSPPATDTNSNSRYEFSTGTIGSDGSFPFPVARGRVSHGMRSHIGAYFGGGYKQNGGTQYSNIYRLGFESGTFLGPYGNFPMNVGGAQALMGAVSAVKPGIYHPVGEHAYFWGGTTSDGASSAYGYIQKFEFGTGTTLPAQFTPMSAEKGGAVVSNYDYAWKLGGEGPGVSARRSWMQRFEFSVDTRNTRSGTHPLTNGVSNGLSYQTRHGDRGYFSQYYPAPDNIIRQENQTETLSSLGTGTSNNLIFNFTGQSTKSYGYSFGGSQPDNSVPDEINRFDFSTESYTSIPATLDTAVKFGAGAASPQRAHIFGGIDAPGSYSGNIDQFEYSTETASAFPVNMPYVAYAVGAVSNTYEAFLHGGVIPGGPPWASSRKHRLTFSDDTLNTLPSGFAVGHRGDDGCTNSTFK
jgi:hypothetical protein